MKICTMIQIEQLRPNSMYCGNRIATEDTICLLSRKLEHRKLEEPLLVGANLEIIDGHVRYLAALKAGRKRLPVCIDCSVNNEDDAAKAYKKEHLIN